ncbi:diphthine--ammonia ligase [Pyrofollis japonicus]|uniref:diphthine--ammonia ligase n=1 Tax=Pyrofollis japonicus TaxID=3060460 RepID=UPI00295B35C1|nr:diphthine--ammonia ligase [Pyrofollis japonicus]
MRVCAMLSGGKDSIYALHWAVMHGFELCCTLIIEPAKQWESMLFHYPNIWVARLQSEALGVDYVVYSSREDEEASLIDAFKLVAEKGCEAIVSGALLSDYQRLRFAIAAEENGLKSFTPLWRINQEEYMRGLVREGFKVMVTSVQAYGLPGWLVGKILDEKTVEMIISLAKKYRFNPAFEGGEAETLVLDAPLFRKELRVEGETVRLGPDHYFYEIKRAWLVPKPSVSQ